MVRIYKKEKIQYSLYKKYNTIRKEIFIFLNKKKKIIKKKRKMKGVV